MGRVWFSFAVAAILDHVFSLPDPNVLCAEPATIALAVTAAAAAGGTTVSVLNRQSAQRARKRQEGLERERRAELAREAAQREAAAERAATAGQRVGTASAFAEGLGFGTGTGPAGLGSGQLFGN